MGKRCKKGDLLTLYGILLRANEVKQNMTCFVQHRGIAMRIVAVRDHRVSAGA